MPPCGAVLFGRKRLFYLEVLSIRKGRRVTAMSHSRVPVGGDVYPTERSRISQGRGAISGRVGLWAVKSAREWLDSAGWVGAHLVMCSKSEIHCKQRLETPWQRGYRQQHQDRLGFPIR